MKNKLLVSAAVSVIAIAFAGSANAAPLQFFGEDLNPGLTGISSHAIS